MHVHVRLVVTFSSTSTLSFALFCSSVDSFESLVHSLRFFVAGINFSHKVWQTLDLHINDLAVFGNCFWLGGRVGAAADEALEACGIPAAWRTLATWHHSSCQLFQRVLHFKRRHEEKCQASSKPKVWVEKK